MTTETQIERNMTISHSEFFRLLPKALKAYLWQQQKNDTSITVELASENTTSGEIIIALSKQGQFTIGSLTLPVTCVTFQIKNVAKKTQDDFFQAFDRAYQRGGG
ncbi:hypothetical protein SPBRAN_567 [uncultured Candidatus Thioglobus sp.]|nr:hypothetical protein SPBRAN_567 [uncultured Candidatus Thioglobus sp.]